MTTLRLILWDQLSPKISSLEDLDPAQDIIFFCETREECTYVKHHQKKLVFLLASMRHFAQELRDKGYRVIYVTLDDPLNTGTLQGEIHRFLQGFFVDALVITWPGEYRVLQILQDIQASLKIPVTIREDTRFLSSLTDFSNWATPRKELRMEYFYRHMRQKHHILMEEGGPVGGRWNFDADNRKPPRGTLPIPPTYTTPPDALTQEVMTLVGHHFADHFGRMLPFHFAVTAAQARQAFGQFVSERLSFFGDYQDAMLENQPWMYHAHISFYLNVGLLDPLECIREVEKAYRTGQAALNSAEGFIRQILGWREYVRGIYWLKMPTYKTQNFLQASRPLPDFYWTGQTKMNCLRQCITETQDNAYAHHIQRLMVLGNFALLAGLNPQAVHEWYLLVYADAFEWVELPNVIGMILFADGGYLGSKPYAASGAYIQKMSSYCKNCAYDVTQKTGPQACPFNYLYWDFLIRQRDRLQKNPRLSMIYAVLNKKDPAAIQTIQSDAENFLASLDKPPTSSHS